MSLTNKEVREYWEARASNDESIQSTTQDYYLRKIETRVLSDFLLRKKPRIVVDLGCGDARTTCALAQQLPKTDFIGIDYSESMINNAERVIADTEVTNVKTVIGDITKNIDIPLVDVAFTTRCLINITDTKLQKTAIRNIHSVLQSGGIYLMIENFVEGQRNFNEIRERFGLPPIPLREHNLFFKHNDLLRQISGKFEIVKEVNISSTYYLVSRIIYSKICQDTGENPDYFDVHHKYSADLPFSGEYGPVRMIAMRKV